MRVGSVLHVQPRGLWAVLHAGPRFIGRRGHPFGGAARRFVVTISIRTNFEDSTLETSLAFLRRSRSCAVLDNIDRCFDHRFIPGDNRIYGAGGAVARHRLLPEWRSFGYWYGHQARDRSSNFHRLH